MPDLLKTAALGASIIFGGAIGANAADVTFETLDTDQSGALSLAEIQAAMPGVDADALIVFDEDASGDLSREEFTAWRAAAMAE